MTVKELMELLREFPETSIVMIESDPPRYADDVRQHVYGGIAIIITGK